MIPAARCAWFRLMIGMALLVGPARALAGGPGVPRDAVREAAVVAELRAQAAEAVPEFESATAALDKRDYPSAAAGYRRVLEKAPNSDVVMRRLGFCLMENGSTAEGLALQERALAQRRSAANLASFAQCLALPVAGARPTPDALRRARALINEAITLEPHDPQQLALRAQLELNLEDTAAFLATSAALCRLAPDDMGTHYYAAIAAAMSEKWLTAEREIRAAERCGLPAAAAERFLAAGVGARARLWRWGLAIAVAAGAWALGLVVMFLIGKVLSLVTLASIERDDPNQVVSGQARRLRGLYRRILALGGIYWYVSLPFVALIVVVATAGIIYAFIAAGRVPIKLAAILVIGALVSLYAIVRSLFIRIRDDEDPGRAIGEADAPGLWSVAREVAVAVGTRPIDQIWLTPGTDVAVFERGSTRQRMQDAAPRALLLGAGVIEGFEQGAFRAVLAHEYGHFAHRDTAGGEVALRVRNSIYTFAMALAKSGYAVWWNLAFQFLRLYNLLFRRISHGATRLQEVLADRVAIQHYGLDAFRNGLTHVIRRSILFGKLAGQEINQAVEQKRPLVNLYALTASTDAAAVDDLEQQVTKELQQRTTEDDTHPGPNDRFRLGARIRSAATPQAGGYVWELFDDPVAIKAEMTAVVARRVAASSGAPVAT